MHLLIFEFYIRLFRLYILPMVAVVHLSTDSVLHLGSPKLGQLQPANGAIFKILDRVAHSSYIDIEYI